MTMQNEREQNTHSKGERVKIPLLPYNADKKSANNSGPTVGSQQSLSLTTRGPTTSAPQGFVKCSRKIKVCGCLVIKEI